MDRKYIVLFAIILIGLLSACSFSDSEKTDDERIGETKTSFKFTGTIEEIIDHRAIVSAKSGDIPKGNVFVDLSVNNDKKFGVGDKIIVGFDGAIEESDPAQINTISVELVDQEDRIN